jgi:hypothetical protein
VGADAAVEACDGAAEGREVGAPEARRELGVDAGVGGLEDAAAFCIGDGGGVKWWWWWWSMGGRGVVDLGIGGWGDATAREGEGGGGDVWVADALAVAPSLLL